MSNIEQLPTTKLQHQDANAHLHPFADYRLKQQQISQIIVKGDGVYVWDSEGHCMIDAMAGLWCTNVGYGRKSIADAVHKQMLQLSFYNTFFHTTHLPAIELATKLVEISPAQFNHVFFVGSGSEGNDTIVRLVRHYWNQKEQPGRQIIISRQNAYHGSTMAGASLGGWPSMHKQGGLPIPGIVHIGQPSYLEGGQGKSVEEFGLEAASWLENKIRELGPENVAAFIGEPVQGAGGVIVPPSTYWPEIQRICDKYGILLVADEVICGFGRLGTWFGCEALGFRPDLITFAKGVTSGYVPLGGVLVADRIVDTLAETGGEFNHGFTYSGHPIGCVAALENIRILEQENILNQVKNETGPYFQQKLTALNAHPLVGNSGGIGFLGGFNLYKHKGSTVHDHIPFSTSDNAGNLARANILASGVIVRLMPGDRLLMSPPLTLTRKEIDDTFNKITQGLDKTYEQLKQNARERTVV
ncbi:aminotransferase [Sapientia aquatica]|uniref:Aminotransferase class III-fold pyridoxal phosphate-dependent enzyme n=1 Tax=Sapientia aquatica TaxID=1549640 RepID=A0A4R5VNH2_9BURK|nr:aminotransferase [Sapientia aquatica]TDK59650.1 aminotransferase class III-fold pyridoxal phosphate-dependent enzyme [Sapientia aquatica]